MVLNYVLFDEYKYFAYQFPEPQYLGAKFTLLSWINKHIPKNVNIVLDAFAGSQSVSYLFKQHGFKVLCNDFLNFCHQIGLSLIENKNEILTNEDLEILFNEQTNSEKYSLISEIYTNVFFDNAEAKFLDKFRANIDLLDNKYKKALAFTLINRSLTRKVTMGHFGHTQALNYANDPERVKRNPNLARPIKNIFLDLVFKYNNAIFDNNKDNKSYNENILDLLPKLEKIDLVYFDPPYCDSHADYQSFYHLLETYVEYWKGKKFINNTKRYEPQRFSGFDKKAVVIDSLNKLFIYAKDIPYWLISWNDRSYPDIKTFAYILSKYKDVAIEQKIYKNGRGGKGSVAGSQEILFICKNKLAAMITVDFMEKIQKVDFSYWKREYETDKLDELSFNNSGLLWLKIKSITRKIILDDFLKINNITLASKKLNDQFSELYNLLSDDLLNAHKQLDDFIKNKNQEQLKKLDINKLVSELFKLRNFEWGGDYKNALDKYLVDRYVKVYQSYDTLVSKFDTDISRAVQGYVLCSWYSHWSSILIEYIFKNHPIVLPTVGQIKKVDFFINNIPFDLKVTFLPVNFIEKKRKEKKLKSELTELKQQAKKLGILFTNHTKADDTYYEIVEKIKNKNDDNCKEVLENIKKVRLDILNEVRKNPKILIQNLYEEQGEPRFSSENRLFLVLVDTKDFDNSWKLRRNLDLLKPSIQDYLDGFTKKKMDDLKIKFHYKTKEQLFTAWSDIIFVVK